MTYLHHFEFEDGSVVSIKTWGPLPRQALVDAMLLSGYDYIHTTRV